MQCTELKPTWVTVPMKLLELYLLMVTLSYLSPRLFHKMFFGMIKNVIVEHCFSYKHVWNNLLNFVVYFQLQYKGYQEHLHWHNILPAKNEVSSQSGLYLCLLFQTYLTERGWSQVTVYKVYFCVCVCVFLGTKPRCYHWTDRQVSELALLTDISPPTNNSEIIDTVLMPRIGLQFLRNMIK